MATDFYLEIITSSGPIKGESKDGQFPNQLQIDSWKFQVDSGGSASQGGSNDQSKPTFRDLEITAVISTASPNLMKAAAAGTLIKQATISCRKGTGTKAGVYLQVRLHDAFISTYNAGHSGGEGLPRETFSINFDQVEFAYFRQKDDGSMDPSAVLSGWDQNKNAAATPTLGKK